ncbi:CFEM domain-containing protein [Colletotrichum sojae]|uniref:CFEM domain-containing protein n=1 Tax=Colletotrichum sojae TaxID=2175907 RepID=A0A8H6J5R0_9PEZI|nr:CFEM domain-containing protein [Colletotrichum sojae]
MRPASTLAAAAAFAMLPAACWQKSIPEVCGTWENAQCICRDGGFDLDVTQCMSKSCPRLSTFGKPLRILNEPGKGDKNPELTICLETLREWDTMCDRTRRDRKGDVWPFLPIHLFAMTCVAARLYSKSWIIRRFGLDDWVITVTYVLYIVWFSIGHHIFQQAFGMDIWWTDPDTLTWALKLFYIDAPIYLVLLGLTKVSILCFYLRLFPYERFCRLCYVLLAIVITSTVAWVILAIVQCRPISYNWEGWKGDFEGPVKCVNLNVLFWTTSAVSITLDTIILIMPMPLLVKVKSTPRRKVAIISMFSLGIVIIIASCLRLRFNIMYGESVNITWDYVDLLIWTGVEVATSIAVTSLPSIRLMLHRLFPGLFSRIFAFGGHVDMDREQYMVVGEAREGDVERMGMEGITRRHRKNHDTSQPPPTIGGGTPRGRATMDRRPSAARIDTLKPKKVVTEASRILASIIGSSNDSQHRPSMSPDDTTDDSIVIAKGAVIKMDETTTETASGNTAAGRKSKESDDRDTDFSDWRSVKWDLSQDTTDREV